jgi:1-deoxy-D-xylulose 5-phosphate reductoisomerase
MCSAQRTFAPLATGSISDSTLEVVEPHRHSFRVAALAAHRNWRKLAYLGRRAAGHASREIDSQLFRLSRCM